MNQSMLNKSIALAALVAVCAICPSSLADDLGSGSADVVYVGTPNDVVARMLRLADVTQNDVVYDLGCGDGRIVIMAAKLYGARGVGYDINPVRVRESIQNAKRNNVEDLVTI